VDAVGRDTERAVRSIAEQAATTNELVDEAAEPGPAGLAAPGSRGPEEDPSCEVDA
jgi:hypothetical protein